MMLFPMEALVSRGGDLVGGRIKDWVNTVHARCVFGIGNSNNYVYSMPGYLTGRRTSV